MADFFQALNLTLLNEGGYQDDPNDQGNYYQGVLVGTNYGISASTLASFLGRAPSQSDMQNMDKITAEAIYQSAYWDSHNLTNINSQIIANQIFDMFVTTSASGVNEIVNNAIATIDNSFSSSYFSNDTIQEINTLCLDNNNCIMLNNAMVNYRIAYLSGLSSASSYLTGWAVRAQKYLTNAALLLIQNPIVSFLGLSTAIGLVYLGCRYLKEKRSIWF